MDKELTLDTDPEDVYQFHVALLEAIRTRDPNLTRQRLFQHFDHVKTRIDQYLLRNKTAAEALNPKK